MIDILVPVLGRPHNVQPLLESLSTTHEAYRVFFICSPDDTAQIEACLDSGQETLTVHWHPGKADYAKKINWGFEQTDSEWVFQGADDIRFKDNWDTAALRTAALRGKRVIGTNDLHNPLVKRGGTSTHTLFRRSYIEEYGGTHDNTGRVLHEGYDHQYVDNEFCETARRRDEWAFCKQSIVEHLHPHWGLVEEDETYRKADRARGQDFRRYHQRMGRRKNRVPT